MTWLKIDDELARAPEWLKIDDVAFARTAEGLPSHERAAQASSAAASAKFVHLVSSMWAADALSDGLLPRAAVSQICALASIDVAAWYAAAELLQAAGMWDRRRSAPWKMIITWRPGDQPTAEAEHERKRRGRRRTALGRTDLPFKLEAIERAGGRCEYCDKKLSEREIEIDHVDPAGWNELSNLSVSCGSCNRRKGSRTLEAAKMRFTKRAAQRRATWGLSPSRDSDSNVTELRAVSGSSTGRVGTGSGAGPVGTSVTGEPGA